jgi:hypothetical protein
MEITRELLTGNIHLTLEVYATPGEADHPARFKVTITPPRAAQIRQMAAIIRDSKDKGLDIWSLHAWDYSGDWLACAEDDEVRLTTTHRSYIVREPFEYFERALECIDAGALFHPSNEAEQNAPTGAGKDHRSSVEVRD